MTSADERPSVTRPPNWQLSALIEQAGMSNKQLARAVRETAARHGRDARCTHTSVQRWRDGRMSRAVPPALIAETLSLALGRVLTPADIGMPVDDRPLRPPLATDFIEVPEELTAAARRLWLADLDRQDAIRADLPVGALTGPALHWLLAENPTDVTGYGPGPEVTPADVRRLRETTRAFGLIARRHGGAAAHRPAVQYLLSDLGPLLAGRYPDPIGRALFGAAALGSLHVGDWAHDSGLQGLGRRYHLLSLFLAHRAGDRVLGGQALTALAASFSAPGDQPTALDLLRAVLLGTQQHPEWARASAYGAAGCAHAALRDAPAAERALLRALDAITAGEPSDDPAPEDPPGTGPPTDGPTDGPWGRTGVVTDGARARTGAVADSAADVAELFDRQALAEAEVRSRLLLGEYALARRLAQQALLGYGPDDTVRSVLLRCLLATARLRSGLLDGACEAGEQALQDAAGLQSAAVDAHLGRLATDLEAQRGAGRPGALAKQIRGQRPLRRAG